MSSAAGFDPQQIAAFILAGGQSSRMGQDKARLLWHGRPLVEWLQRQIQPLAASVTLVVKRSEEYADLVMRWIQDYQVKVVGGCCGTRAEHIEALSRRIVIVE